jgi:two-component system, NtrC family, response regulator
MARVLIVDDDRLMCLTLSELVERMGHYATCAQTLKDGLQQALSQEFDVVLLDVRLPDGDGLTIIPPIQGTPSSPEIIIITGYGDPDGAELAIRSGAWDYLQKPCSSKNVVLQLKRALQYREQSTKTKGASVKMLKRENIIGDSPKMRACFSLLAEAANSETSVLLVGETGTGKELFARAVHDNSPRASQSFVVLDCAALPDTLVESVLFGHIKGAFTGADVARDGLIMQAHRGTLFLDEVGELSMGVQKAFLRVLQERRFRAVGDKAEKESDFRLVAATNQNIEGMARAGLYRQDLLFRLQGITIELPPLRERREDLRDLTMHFLTRLSERKGVAIKGISPEFMGALAGYDWPGNVRELFNALEKAFVAATHNAILYPKHLPNHVRIHVARHAIRHEAADQFQTFSGAQNHEARAEVRADTNDQAPGLLGPELGEAIPAFREFSRMNQRKGERRYLTDLLAAARGDIKKACELSGLSPSRLYELIKKHGLTRFGG